MKEHKDYCGPYWMPSFIRRFLSNWFNASCKIHDRDYGKAMISRDDADRKFLVNCIRQAKGVFLKEVMACGFFIAVRIGGKLSWKKDK